MDELPASPKAGASEAGAGAYLAVPLWGPDGAFVGVYGVAEREARRWSERDVKHLQALAESVTAEIALQVTSAAAEFEAQHHAIEEACATVALDTLLDLFFVLDPDGAFIRWNEQMQEVTGYSEAELGAMYAIDVFGPEDQPRVAAAIERVLSEGEAVVEAQVVTKAGEQIPFEFNGRALRDGTGRIIGLSGTGRDLTERKEAEQRLRASEKQNRLLAMMAARTVNGVVFADPEGRIEWVNDGFTRINGYTLDEVKGRTPGCVLQGPDSDGATDTFMRRKLQAHEGFQAEIVNYHKEGHPFWVSLDVQPLYEEDGTFTGFMGIQTDITERRRAEEARREQAERLSLALSAAHMATWDYDFETRTVTWFTESDELSQFGKGTVRADESTLYATIHPDDRADVREAVAEAAQSDDMEAVDVTYRAVREDQERYRRAIGRLMRDDDGQARRMIGVVMDVTRQRQYEEGLIEAHREADRARREAEEMVRLKDALLNNMSHEIRTPLTTIIGFADVLAEEVQGEHEPMVQMIQESGERLLTTLNSVLDLAQLESGTLTVKTERVDVAREAEATTALFEQQAQAKGLVLTCYAPGQPVWAHVDRSAVQRVLTNLISNAIKFTDEGRVEVRVTHDRDGGEIVVSVEDTGVGMAESFLAHVFSPFRQESSGLARSHEGSGLGLTIVERLVDLIGGRIDVASEEGVGSVFQLRLPIEEHVARPGLATADDRRPVHEPATGGRVLVIDDSHETRLLVERLLAGSYEVTTVGSAEAALAEARRTPYDVLLLDVSLGEETSGVEVLHALREDPDYQMVPIVAFTAHALPGAEERFRSEGFDAYLAKPFTSSALRELTGRLVA